MDDASRKLITDDIAPLVQAGHAALFLGAGFSYKTPAKSKQPIPSTSELITRILLISGYDPTQNPNTDLSIAFAIGQSSKKVNFDEFLLATFDCDNPFEWQQIPFKYWWRRIFTTNIDTVIQAALKKIREKKIEDPDFQIFNYRDSRPATPDFLKPPVVFLHGSIEHLLDGFVFDAVQYADYSVRGGDWLNDAALHLAHGHCVLVGSRFREPDLEVALRERAQWTKDAQFNKPSWIVLPQFTAIEKATYLSRNIQPIEATAEEFFKVLEENLTVQSPGKYLKKIAPHVRLDTDATSALAYFSESFLHVATVIGKESGKTGLLSRYFTGDIPTWFYIAKNVPARFSYLDEVLQKVREFDASGDPNPVLCAVITGPIGSGKSTASLQILRALSEIHHGIYAFDSPGGLDIEKTWSILKEMKGLVVFYFDKSSEYFYALNELAKRVIKDSEKLKVVFLIEEREIEFNKNTRHLSIFSDKAMHITRVPPLSLENAGRLVEAIANAGLSGGKIKSLDPIAAAKLIIDKDIGYRGDLLATMCDVVSDQTFEKYLDAEYGEIIEPKAKKIFNLLSLITAARMMIPIEYVADINGISVSSTLTTLRRDLSGKIFFNDAATLVSSRHQIIAEYHLKKFIDLDEKADLIIELMQCVSRKFQISDIRLHPLPYRIYRATLSHDFLRISVFGNASEKIARVYSACQVMFAHDAIFWLQYGKFLHDEKRLDDALHCLRKGLDLYDSFQIRHALGQLLIDLYIKSNASMPEYYEEGVRVLSGEISLRGKVDPYPYTTLAHQLMNVIERVRNDTEVRELLREVVNQGLRDGHRQDRAFQKMISRGIAKGHLASI